MLEATFRLSTLCIQSGDAVSCYSSKLHVNKIIEKCKQIDLPSECLQHLDKDLNALETKLQNMESSA